MPIKTARDIPTTNRTDSNGYLDEQIAVQLCLKVLPAGTLSLKSPCQLPVDALRVFMAAGHLSRIDMPAAGMFVCIVMYVCLVFYIYSRLLGSGWFGCLFVLMYCKECGMF